MRKLLAWLGEWVRRPLRLLFVLASGAVLLAVFSPFLYGSYHWWAGQSALKRYHNAQACAHLNASLRIWPWSRSAATHVLAARAARRAGNLDEAAQLLQDAQARLGDQSSETLLEWALLHASGGDLDKVEGFLQDHARKHPEHVTLVLEALGEGYLRMARIAEALHCADEWLSRDPDNVQAFYLRGNIYRQTGASSKVVPDFRRVVELDPERSQIRRWLADTLVDIGRYEEAAQHLELLRQQQPEDVDLLARLAVCRHRLGQSRDARSLLDYVLERRPDHGLALLTRGQMARMSGQLKEAEKWLRHAAGAMPHDYKARWALTECLREQGKLEEAEREQILADRLRDRWVRFSEITTHIMSQQRNNPALQCELGQLMLELGIPEIGKNWLLSALRLDEHYIPALKALADYYQERGDTEQAEEYRRRATQSAAQRSPRPNS